MARKGKQVYQIKKKRNFFNPATVIFLAIFFYVVLYVLAYATKDHTSVYRVVSETSEDVIRTQGICLRDEITVRADRSGYVNYYIGNLSRCAKNDAICSIDDTGTIYNKLQSDTGSGNALDTDLMELIRHYHINNENSFDSIYSLKQKFTNAVLNDTSKNMLSNLSEVMRDYGNSDYFHVNYATESGIIVYSSDNYDGLTEEDIDTDRYNEIINASGNASESSISEENSNVGGVGIDSAKDNKVNSGDVLYKIVTGETWHSIIMIDKDHYEKLSNLDIVSVRINNSSYTANAGVRLYESGGNYFADLTFYNYMVNFAEERVLNVSVKLDSVSGLKIPKSSVIKKDCFVVSSDFYTTNEKTDQSGFFVYNEDESGNKSVVFTEVPVYAIIDKNEDKDEENNKKAYIDANGNITAGDKICDKDGKTTESVSKMDSLMGVYCVNKGYPEFKRIEITAEFDDYYLVADNTSFGLSEYDNIIVNPTIDANLKE